jgi:hypothetical protein
MLKKNNKLIYWKWKIKNFIGQQPWLFYPIMKLRYWYATSEPNEGEPTIWQLVNKDTQLVIEGFPRSANTFAVFALQYAQPFQLKIAYHFHASAQIFRAISLGIPTLVVIRNPRDSVASFVARWSEVSESQALELYISFYKSISKYKASYVIGDFEEITQNFSKIIQRINSRFGTNFVLFSDSQEDRAKVLEKILKDRSSFSSPNDILKKNILRRLSMKKNQTLLAEAEKVYQEFVEYNNSDSES